MNIHTLLKHERELVKSISLDNTLNDYTLFARKHLQLHIKMGELANETKCYKYWIGEVDSVNFEKVFHKYITCFHQILLLGLDENFEHLESISAQVTDSCLSGQFLNLYIDINDSIMSSSEDHFITLVEDYLTLGMCLGFSEEQILDGIIQYKIEVAI